MTTSGSALDKSKPNMPLSGLSNDGYSKGDVATATCYCGAVQLEFPTEAPSLLDTFVCNCFDCYKITASMFASNFIVDDRYLKHNRGQENLTSFRQNHTIARLESTTSERYHMINCFCKTCGTLMYRVPEAFPGQSILRIGTVDDFSLMETKLKPRREQFVHSRVSWLKGVDGPKKSERLNEDTLASAGGVGVQ
ncbi:hypothetical protein LTR37_020487 [Vermiconidia calcicola]|uniref:Uncharacterized protein n=1 Tax=Vermiconidia calcicola TaxID=1690605 RepID=A0ACC3MB18_9PEZI|nr:hypothetical protein LTR37_020487 [Vermiconidia calcicola]